MNSHKKKKKSFQSFHFCSWISFLYFHHCMLVVICEFLSGLHFIQLQKLLQSKWLGMQMHLVCRLPLLTEDQVSDIGIDPLCDLPPKHFLLTSKFLADFMTSVSYLNKQNKEKKKWSAVFGIYAWAGSFDLFALLFA